MFKWKTIYKCNNKYIPHAVYVFLSIFSLLDEVHHSFYPDFAECRITSECYYIQPSKNVLIVSDSFNTFINKD